MMTLGTDQVSQTFQPCSILCCDQGVRPGKAGSVSSQDRVGHL